MRTISVLERASVSGGLLKPGGFVSDIGVLLDGISVGMEWLGAGADATGVGIPIGVSLGIGGLAFGAVGAIATAAGD